MGDSNTSRNLPEELNPQAGALSDSSARAIATMAALAAQSVAAERCAIAWNVGARNHVVWLPDRDSRWDAAIVTILSALENRISDVMVAERDLKHEPALTNTNRISMTARELASLDAGAHPFQDGAQFVASALCDGHNSVRIVLVAAHDRSRKELEAMLDLLCLAALTRIVHEADSATLDFWRAHASKSAAEAHAASKAVRQEREQTQKLDSALVAAHEFPRQDRLARLGALVADFSGHKEWLVAIPENGALKIAATSAPVPPLAPSDNAGALSRCWHDREVVESVDDPFRGACLCIPFEAGVFALASDQADAAARARAEAIFARLVPIVKCWTLEDEAARHRALVDRLALRIYAAVDEERARISRDMHDDQAQLLTAAKIALTGKPEQARAILQKIEEELRRKTRELRPASLGDATLEEALEREFKPLREAGINARLRSSNLVISRPTQHLCFRVVREVLFNVSKHARATSVEVALSYHPKTRTVRLSIVDNGAGIDTAHHHDGVGLTGLRERLGFVGGTLSIESDSSGTKITAEIPEISHDPLID